MDFQTYSIEFSKLASSSGYSEQNIQKCLNYARVLFENNVPVIYNISNLCALVGYNSHYIKKAALFPSRFYREFEIDKANGCKRIIHEPLPSLKSIQVWILNNILNNVEVSPFAKAYKHKLGLVDNIKFHRKQQKVYCLDIKDFFSSITREYVEEMFLNLGYSKSVSNIISKLCTREGVLPQGAPTSPYLSNIYLKRFDELLSEYCIKNKIRYTRYADDLTFSGDFDENQLNEYVNQLLQQNRLNINDNKTRLMLPHERQIVTGVVVNEKGQASIRYRNEIRKTIYFIKKFGLEDHMKHEKISQQNYIPHLLGKVNFVLYLNPTDKEFIKYKEVLINLKTM